MAIKGKVVIPKIPHYSGEVICFDFGPDSASVGWTQTIIQQHASKRSKVSPVNMQLRIWEKKSDKGMRVE